MSDLDAPFTPDWVSPPGDTIADVLEERGWTQAELAQRMGCTEQHVSQLIDGKAAITQDTALRLERTIGGTADFWLRKEARYRERIAGNGQDSFSSRTSRSKKLHSDCAKPD